VLRDGGATIRRCLSLPVEDAPEVGPPRPRVEVGRMPVRGDEAYAARQVRRR